MYQLIASDLDGTLLTPEHRVDPYTATTLQRLSQQGVQFALATGRHHKDVVKIRQSLGIPAYLISSNGARVHSPDNELIYTEDVPVDIVQELARPEYTSGCKLNFYLDNEWLIDQPYPEMLAMHQDSGFFYQVEDLARHSGTGVAKVLYMAENSHLLELEKRIDSRFGNRIYLTFTAPTYLEVMAPGVSKGHALQMVMDKLGMDASHCMAFGDGQNDIELLQSVGHPRMMANADERLINSLPDAPRIGSNHDSGVARYLRQVFAL